MQVTTDTPEYCGQLAGEIERKPDAPAEVRELTEEGTQMCRHELVKGGLIRLRRAGAILRENVPLQH